MKAFETRGTRYLEQYLRVLLSVDSAGCENPASRPLFEKCKRVNIIILSISPDENLLYYTIEYYIKL